MRIYIAQPMADLTDEEITETRKRAIAEIISKHQCEESDIVNNYHPEWKDINPVAALGLSIYEYLADADIVYFINEYGNSRGCMVEKHICEVYGIPQADIWVDPV